MTVSTVVLAQGVEVTSVLVQYGALGCIALLALGAVRTLFQREVRAHDLERKRADRLERELRELHATVQDRYITTLSEAAHTMGEVLERMEQLRRRGAPHS